MRALNTQVAQKLSMVQKAKEPGWVVIILCLYINVATLHMCQDGASMKVLFTKCGGEADLSKPQFKVALMFGEFCQRCSAYVVLYIVAL